MLLAEPNVVVRNRRPPSRLRTSLLRSLGVLGPAFARRRRFGRRRLHGARGQRWWHRARGHACDRGWRQRHRAKRSGRRHVVPRDRLRDEGDDLAPLLLRLRSGAWRALGSGARSARASRAREPTSTRRRPARRRRAPGPRRRLARGTRGARRSLYRSLRGIPPADPGGWHRVRPAARAPPRPPRRVAAIPARETSRSRRRRATHPRASRAGCTCPPRESRARGTARASTISRSSASLPAPRRRAMRPTYTANSATPA